ncbi:MAG: hypothetical protein JST89_23815 [Cyanobacteria bacterium SZAS-4]|nr:hypothetical protein [Cyanobacteria bacterium SZAS-4]
MKSVGTIRVLAIVVFGYLLACINCAASAAPATKPFFLKPDEELDLGYEVESHRRVNVRVCSDYLVVDMPDHHMVIVAQAPGWNVRAISPVRKLVGVSTQPEWVRRGSPFNFLKVTSIPEWPLVKQGTKPYLDWQATYFVLPYKTQDGAIVPLKRGQVGDFLVLGEGVLPKQACQIVSTLIQTPKAVSGLPVQLNLWDTEKTSTKMNSLFLFSGVKQSGPKAVIVKSAAVNKRRSLPSSEGYKVCKDPRDVWVSNADTEGFEGLMH